MRIALIFNKAREDTIGVYFARALEAMGYEFDHFWTRDSASIKGKYDLYLRIDHGDYTQDIPSSLRPCAFYVVDTNFRKNCQKIKTAARHYDFVFCVQRSAAMEFKDSGINAFWVPPACDPAIHSRLDLAKRYDIGFVGSSGGSPRKFVLQALRERFPDSFIGSAPFTEIGRIYSQARIGFHFIRSQSRFPDAVSMRFFEVMSCGTMLLANKVEGESLDELGVRDREHLVLYKEPKEIFPLAEYYLKHEREREEIAQKGYKLVLARHTYRRRVEQIMEIISK